VVCGMTYECACGNVATSSSPNMIMLTLPATHQTCPPWATWSKGTHATRQRGVSPYSMMGQCHAGKVGAVVGGKWTMRARH
jgi:hypothetical protein